MQLNVLSETMPKKEAKIVKLNWAYSAAAAVALLFGITFFVNQQDADTDLVSSEKQIANNVDVVATDSLPVDNLEKPSVVSTPNAEQDLTNVVASNQTESTVPSDIVEQKKSSLGNQEKISTFQNSDSQVDQILANFSSADLADLGKNTEQDVYLDLYN
jgi:hypothetical protein